MAQTKKPPVQAVKASNRADRKLWYSQNLGLSISILLAPFLLTSYLRSTASPYIWSSKWTSNNVSLNYDASSIISSLPRHPRLPQPPNHITVASAWSLRHVAPSPANFLQTPSHPRYRLLAALFSMAGYLQSATPIFEAKLQHYETLHERNRKLFPEFPFKVSQALVAASVNAYLTSQITAHGMAVYNISQAEVQSFADNYAGAENHPRTNWALRHLVRDWAASGSYERDTTFPAILTSGVLKGRVMVPGACVGRLAAEIAALKSVTHVVANEYNFLCIICGRWILDRVDGEKENFDIYPRIEDWSNHRSTSESLLHPQPVPDVVHGNTGSFEWREGDFVAVLKGPSDVGTYQTVVTLFFIDTASDIVEYLTRIWKSLESGGHWVNLGPIQYGGSDKLLELSLDEVLKVAERIGFVLEKVGGKAESEIDSFEGDSEEATRWAGKVKTWKAEYTTQKMSLRHNVYDVKYWVARKP